MTEGSRRGSVQTVQGFCVSMLPQVPQISIFSSAVCRAARRARSEPRQAREQLYQSLDFRSGDGGWH